MDEVYDQEEDIVIELEGYGTDIISNFKSYSIEGLDTSNPTLKLDGTIFRGLFNKHNGI